MSRRAIRRRGVIFLALCGVLATAAAAPATGPPGDIRLRLDPSLPTTQDEVTLHLSGSSECQGLVDFQPAVRDGSRLVVRAEFATFAPCEDFGPFRDTVSLGRLEAGDYVVEASINAGPVSELAFEVTAPAFLRLHGGRFVATLSLDPDNLAGPWAPAVALSADSGYFWLYDSGNVEVTIKVLDGSAINGQPWIFLANMTDRPFLVAVYDNATGCFPGPRLPACPHWTYRNPSGTARNVIDLAPFD